VLSCRKISATMPPFQISGNASDVLKHSRLSILQGRYDELGSSVSVLSHFGIMPEIGSHDIAIDASKLLKSSVLRAGFDWYDLSGEACNTISHFAVIAPVVGFNSFGNAIGIKRNYVLSNEVCACGISDWFEFSISSCRIFRIGSVLTCGISISFPNKACSPKHPWDARHLWGREFASQFSTIKCYTG